MSASACSRRRFVVSSVSLAGLGACRVRPDDQTDVVVVGAGLAGLAAALELQQSGLTVEVIESETVVGGRVRTVRGAMDHDVWLDVGAQGGSDQYVNFVDYCKRFDLPLVSNPRAPGRPDTQLQLKGKRYLLSELAADPSAWPLTLSVTERKRAPSRLLFAVLAPLAQKVASTERVLDEQFAHYDSLSVGDLLRQEGLSRDAIALVEHTANYNSLETVSSLSAIRDATRFLTPGKSVFVEGGNGRLPEAMAGALVRPVQTSVRLIELDQSRETVTLRVTDRFGERSMRARRVVLALPFTALRNVRVTPSLPADKRAIIASLPYTQVAKTFVQTRRSFLNTAPRVGAVYSDSPFERVFNMSYGNADEPGLLLNWINGDGLDAFRGLTPNAHRGRVLGWMRELWPQHADQLGPSLTFNWADMPSQGAYAHFAPGQLTRYARVIPSAVDRLHFAGEHTQLVEPGMEGALTSGRRVADEIRQAFTRTSQRNA